MNESLLDAARRELPGVEWIQDNGRVCADVGQLFVSVNPFFGGVFSATCGQLSTGTSSGSTDAFAWLRAQLKAQRDACDKALGDGWRRFGDCRPEESRRVLLWRGVRGALVVCLFEGAWVDEHDYLRPPDDTDLWHPLPELPEVKP